MKRAAATYMTLCNKNLREIFYGEKGKKVQQKKTGGDNIKVKVLTLAKSTWKTPKKNTPLAL